MDHDGYGSGVACMCAGLDCDDADPAVHGSQLKSCYSGAAGTQGLGTCQAGVATCIGGVWAGTCVGEVTPSGEACNKLDDDCNGQVDDGLGTFTCGIGACVKTVAACTAGVVGACVPNPPLVKIDGPVCNGIDDNCNGPIDENCVSCVNVAPTGNDGTVNPALVPFKTIQPAIAWAVAHPAGPQNVCVAAGAACGTPNGPVTGTYTSLAGATVVMADGVSVLGNYESTTWTRCAAATTTVIQPQLAVGVSFGAGIAKVTVLDGFKIDRLGGNVAATSAVTADGAKNVILSNLAITNTPQVQKSYGVDLVNGAEATITQCNIFAGLGSVEAFGVVSVGSKPTIINNCATLDAGGRCNAFCNPANPAIRGAFSVGGLGETYGVLLQDSPNALVESSAICGNNGNDGAGIRIKGDGKGIQIRGNLINAFNGINNSHGVWMEDCKGAAPWVVDNFSITSSGTNAADLVDGIRAIGDCHPVIDSNLLITGGGEGNAASPNGVYCGANAAKVASKCVVLGNAMIRGSQQGYPPIAAGVRCDDGGCMKIAGNTITGRGGAVSFGVWLGATGTFVDRNLISGGCSPIGTGVHTSSSFARLQNNRIFGVSMTDCGAGLPPPVVKQSYGMHVLTGAGGNEVDVHSNDIDGFGPVQACTSRAIELDVLPAVPAGGVGIFRNNVLRGGACSSARYGFVEASTAADPRIFESNDLDPYLAPTALYMDEVATAVGVPGVNMLLDMTTSNNLSVDAGFVLYPGDLHLAAGSLVIGKGTPTGAPAYDMDGKARNAATPDIGAAEH